MQITTSQTQAGTEITLTWGDKAASIGIPGNPEWRDITIALRHLADTVQATQEGRPVPDLPNMRCYRPAPLEPDAGASGRVGYERQGTSYDSGAVGYEMVGRDGPPPKPRKPKPEKPVGMLKEPTRKAKKI